MGNQIRIIATGSNPGGLVDVKGRRPYASHQDEEAGNADRQWQGHATQNGHK
jgi:hypothetical protein